MQMVRRCKTVCMSMKANNHGLNFTPYLCSMCEIICSFNHIAQSVRAHLSALRQTGGDLSRVYPRLSPYGSWDKLQLSPGCMDDLQGL